MKITRTILLSGVQDPATLLSDSVKCLAFHGVHDFAYLLQVLTKKDLPQKESGFFELLWMYFPAICDIMAIMKNFPGLWRLPRMSTDSGDDTKKTGHDAFRCSLRLRSTSIFSHNGRQILQAHIRRGWRLILGSAAEYLTLHS